MRSLKHPCLRYCLLSLCWFPLSITLWLYSQPFIMQGLLTAINPLIQNSFPQSQATLKAYNNDIWHVSTKILTAEQPQDLQKRRYLNIKVEIIFAYTLGFPILWAFLLALSPKFNQWHIYLSSTLILLSLYIFRITLHIFLLTAQIIAESTDLKIEVYPNTYQSVQSYSPLFITLLEYLSTPINVITLFAPLLLIYLIKPQICQTLNNT